MRGLIPDLFCVLLIGFSASAHAAWLALCPGQSITSDAVYAFVTVNGVEQSLGVFEQPPPADCHVKALPVAKAAVNWFKMLSPAEAKQIAASDSFMLQGQQTGSHFKGEVIFKSQSSMENSLSQWPLLLNLLERIKITPFGVEERGQVEREGNSFIFQCQSGLKPAGFIFHTEALAMPKVSGLKLSATYWGDGGFELRANRSDSEQASYAMQTFVRHPEQQTLEMVLPKQDGLQSWNQWTLLCPNNSAHLAINKLQFTLPPKPSLPRSSWIWRANDWQQPQPDFWQKLAAQQISRLYLSIPLQHDLTALENPRALEAFISHASKLGITVWAVSGDPQAVISTEREQWLKRAKAYADYNTQVAKAARLAGLQYDIEPYLAPGYAQNPKAWLQAYLDTLAVLRKASPLALELVVPVWWADEELNNHALLTDLAAVTDGLTVMNYRTNLWLLQDQIQAFLNWGDQYAKPVRVAIEGGPVAAEQRLAFRQAAQGALSLIDVNNVPVLIYFNQPVSGLNEPRFSLVDTGQVSSEAVSYYGQPVKLAEHLGVLEQALGLWQSFSGMAVHEILSTAP